MSTQVMNIHESRDPPSRERVHEPESVFMIISQSLRHEMVMTCPCGAHGAKNERCLASHVHFPLSYGCSARFCYFRRRS